MQSVSVPYSGLIIYIYISQNVMYTPQSYFRPLLGAYFFIAKKTHTSSKASGFRPLLGAYFFIYYGLKWNEITIRVSVPYLGLIFL